MYTSITRKKNNKHDVLGFRTLCDFLLPDFEYLLLSLLPDFETITVARKPMEMAKRSNAIVR